MQSIGRYRLVRVLGRGGQGTVYEAILRGPAGLELPVALKVMAEGASLVREARIGGLLRHPHLVDVYEVGAVEGRWFCAMELCRDGSLAGRRLAPRGVVEVGLQVCDALAYAHEELGLVHRDLKPANLLLDGDLVKVADLGIAHARGFADEGALLGTRGYMPPEQAARRPLDARADIYALGVVLLELLTGGPAGAAATMRLTDAPGDADDAVDQMPAWFGEVAARCLAEDPEDRFPSMRDLARALRELEAEGEPLAAVTAGTRARDGDPRRRLDVFVGRDDDVRSLLDLCALPGIVTLKGGPGLGKSRLARELVARRSGPHAWAALAGAVSTGDLLRVVGDALGVVAGPTDEPAQARQIAHALRARGRFLLVLDGPDGVAEAGLRVADWARAAPEACLLVTGHRSTGAAGERTVEVEPLSSDDAAALFCARAVLRGVHLVPDDDVRRIVARLDGHPFAIELAAGRLGVLTVSDLVGALDLSMLRGGASGRETLRAGLDAAWEGLPEGLRGPLAALSVFAGGFDAAATVAVQGDRGWQAVLQLADRSLVRLVDGGSRGSLLAPVATWAAERLAGPARADAEARHAAWYARLGADEGVARLRASDADAVAVVTREFDNLLAVARRSPGADAAGAILAGLYGAQGPGRLTALADAADTLRARSTVPRLRLVASFVAGAASIRSGEFAAARDRCTEAARLARELSEVALEAFALCNLARALREVDGAGAFAAADAAQEPAVRSGDPSILCAAHHTRGVVLLDRGCTEEAVEEFRRAHATAIAAGNSVSAANVAVSIAVAIAGTGTLDEAIDALEPALESLRGRDPYNEAIGLAHLAIIRVTRDPTRQEEAVATMERAAVILAELGAISHRAQVLGNLGVVHARLRRDEAARRCYADALALQRELGLLRSEAFVLTNLADLELRCGDTEAATELYETGLSAARRAGARAIEGALLAGVAECRARRGFVDEARALGEQAAEILRALDDDLRLARLLCSRVELERRDAGVVAAASWLLELERVARRLVGVPGADAIEALEAATEVLGSAVGAPTQE